MRVLRWLGGILLLGIMTVACLALVNGVLAPTTDNPAESGTLPPPVAPVTVAILARTGPHYARAGYFPSAIRVPAHSTVVIRIIDYDGPASAPAAPDVKVVRGTVEDVVRVQTMRGWDLAALGPSVRLGAFGPGRALAHTFSVPALGINVPVAPHSVETFTIRTGAPGVYVWRCLAPCTDDGPAGPMAERGYMAGRLIVF